MKSNKSVFLSHYKIIKIEGRDPERFINYCLVNNIKIRKTKYISETELNLCIRAVDLEKIRQNAGDRYRITNMGEGGSLYRIGMFLRNKAMVAGFIVFAVIILYQNMFISEIEVSGYESYNEQELRNVMQEVGFSEGCRKNINLNKVKLHVYENFDNIVWVGIKYKGTLAEVTVAEANFPYEKNAVSHDEPCSIVADKSGYINSVDPEVGVRAVKDGEYVKKGDVIISGVIPLEKTTYDEESLKETEMYVHAAGTADARIPVRLNYFETSHYVKKNKTGRRMIFVSVNEKRLADSICDYKTSIVKKFRLIDINEPFRLGFGVDIIEEVELEQFELTEKQLKKEVVNEIHKYAKEKLPDNAQILNKSLNFIREKNIIYIGVTLETLQKIGIEEEIVVDKSNRKSEKNDDQ